MATGYAVRCHVLSAVVALSLMGIPCVYADDQVKVDLSARARVAQADIAQQTGRSQSLQLRAEFTYQWQNHLSATMELQHVEVFSEDEHSDWVRFNGQPIIADTEGPEISQLLLSYRWQAWGLDVGRKRLTIDNQRFIGSDSFWQNDQTFDQMGVNWRLFSASTVQYHYINRVKRIFGDDAGPALMPSDLNFDRLDGKRPPRLWGEHDHNSHLLHFDFNEWDHSRVLLFAHFVDNQDDVSASNDTFGFTYRNQAKQGLLNTFANLTLATQRRTGLAGTPTPFYGQIELGAGWRQWRVTLAAEHLGEDDGASFITPLGSVHDFNGWADVFWFPPNSGLTDYSLKLRWRKSPWQVEVRGHSFHQADNGHKYGEELDIGIRYRPSRHHQLRLNYARFLSDPDSPYSLATQTKVYIDYQWQWR